MLVTEYCMEAGRPPPALQVPQQGRFARPTHAAHREEVAPPQQAPLDLQDVQVAAHKAVAADCQNI